MIAQRSYMPALTGTEIFNGSHDAIDCLANALDELSEGAIFLNGDGQLLWHNRSFDKLMVDNREGHMLVAAVIDIAAEVWHESMQTRNAGSTGSRAVSVGGIAHEVHCTLIPRGTVGAEPFLLSLVKRTASKWSSYEQHLRSTWNLTEREAQVAVQCLQGKKNLEIAEQLRISVETVNKHLDKVYQKAGVRGRAELASRLLDSAF